MQIKKALINHGLHVSKVSWKFRIPASYHFAAIYPWNLLISLKVAYFLIVFVVFSQSVIFKPLGYCFEEWTGFGVKASFSSRPESRLIRWYNITNKPGDKTKNWEKAI